MERIIQDLRGLGATSQAVAVMVGGLAGVFITLTVFFFFIFISVRIQGKREKQCEDPASVS